MYGYCQRSAIVSECYGSVISRSKSRGIAGGLGGAGKRIVRSEEIIRCFGYCKFEALRDYNCLRSAGGKLEASAVCICAGESYATCCKRYSKTELPVSVINGCRCIGYSLGNRNRCFLALVLNYNIFFTFEIRRITFQPWPFFTVLYKV